MTMNDSVYPTPTGKNPSTSSFKGEELRIPISGELWSDTTRLTKAHSDLTRFLSIVEARLSELNGDRDFSNKNAHSNSCPHGIPQEKGTKTPAAPHAVSAATLHAEGKDCDAAVYLSGFQTVSVKCMTRAGHEHEARLAVKDQSAEATKADANDSQKDSTSMDSVNKIQERSKQAARAGGSGLRVGQVKVLPFRPRKMDSVGDQKPGSVKANDAVQHQTINEAKSVNGETVPHEHEPVSVH
ncbi:hypothetical protein BJX61DRAFT_545453 [Aspergillus egyptiacus]|nr:hypothetical protein BJX61DRAFT_545453 [Aspergillus egyptiacus]